MLPQDDDRFVDLLEGVEGLFRNAEDGGQNPGWKSADRLADADVVFGFGRTGVLHDDYLHVTRAAVFEVVEGTLGCEDHVADLLVEAFVVAVSVDESPACDAFGDDVYLPCAGMPVRFANSAGLQRERHDAGLLTLEDREIVLVRLLKFASVETAEGLSAEMEQMRVRADRFIGKAGIAIACRIIGQRHVL